MPGMPLAREAHRWTFVAAAPPREVYAVMEQMLGTFPFRFEMTSAASAGLAKSPPQVMLDRTRMQVESVTRRASRLGLPTPGSGLALGMMEKMSKRLGRRNPRIPGEGAAWIIEFRRKGPIGEWSKRMVRLRTRWVTCEAAVTSAGTAVTVAASRGRGAVPRALQLVQLLTRGASDPRTVYRRRAIPPGPVSLVASWAGMPYQLYAEPRWDAARGAEILTASRVEAIPGGTGQFTRVRLADGTEGYVETDQIVAAPEASTREAQEQAARFV
jgi:hypothetical protein